MRELLMSAFFLMLCTLLNWTNHSEKSGRPCSKPVLSARPPGCVAVGIDDGTSPILPGTWWPMSPIQLRQGHRGWDDTGAGWSGRGRATAAFGGSQLSGGEMGKAFAAHDVPSDEEGRIRHGWLKGVGSWPSVEWFSQILWDASESPGGV